MTLALTNALLSLFLLGALDPACPEWPPELLPYEAHIIEAADFHGLEPSLLAALIWRESGGDPEIISRQGALGLTQVMPGVHTCAVSYPLANIYCGASVLAGYTRNADGDVRAGLAAYYAGETGRENKRDGWEFADLILSIVPWFEPGDGVAWCPDGGWTTRIVPLGRALPEGDARPAEGDGDSRASQRPIRPVPGLLFLGKGAG